MGNNSYILMNDGSFMTIKNDESSSLKHALGYKYIRREKVGDKWRYWYKDDLAGGGNTAAKPATATKPAIANTNRTPKQSNQSVKDPGAATQTRSANLTCYR